MGDPAFMAAFTPGQTLLIDFITQALTGGNTLETIASATIPLSATAPVGSGSVNTPLPTALPLLATGLGGLGLLGWRRKWKAQGGCLNKQSNEHERPRRPFCLLGSWFSLPEFHL